MDKDVGVLEVTDQDIKNLMTEVFKQCNAYIFPSQAYKVIRQCLSLFANIKVVSLLSGGKCRRWRKADRLIR